MRETVEQLVDKLLSGSDLTMDEVLWIGLFGGLVFASLHLLTMFLTRWGDRHATGKSLIFSVLIHLSCSMGLVAIEPMVPTVPEPEEDRQQIQITEILSESDLEVPIDDNGNTQVWNTLTDPVERELARLDRLPPELEPLETPERHLEELKRPDPELPDLPTMPDEPVATPQPEDRGIEGPTQQAADPVKIDDPTAESRPELEVPSTAQNRRPQVRRGQLDEPSIERIPKQGATDRLAPEFRPDQHLASIDATNDPTAFIKRGPNNDETIRNRTGPLPSALPDEAAGTAAGQPNKGATGGSPFERKFSATRTRTPDGIDDGAPSRFRPDRTPRSEVATSDRPVISRNRVTNDVSIPGPEPNVSRPEFDAVRNRTGSTVPSTYRLRDLVRRKEFARRYGGTEESERAVELSLRWLAEHQSAAGYWDADRYGSGQVTVDEQGVDRQRAGIHADAGVTALAVLAFLGAGYTHEEGEYAENVDRALGWLVRQQRSDGYLGGQATHYAKTYCHAMATYAIAEAYGMQSDPTIDLGLREPLQRAIRYILFTQNREDGGWRYLRGQASDMSIFGWQLMALKSADIAGIPIPRESENLLVSFLKSRSHGQYGGLASYREKEPRPSPSMTAEALFCKQMLGLHRTNPASHEAVAYLMQNAPRRAQLNLYYWYYGTLAMFQYGGEPWKQWNETVRDLLVAEQLQTGPEAGSWDARGVWGPYGGRVYSTAVSALCLEVYYRFLPLYSVGGQYDDERE